MSTSGYATATAAGYAAQDATTTEVKQSQVSAQLHELNSAIERFEQLCPKLIGALNTVTRSEPEKASANIATADDVLVPLANELRQMTRRVRAMNEVISSAMQRLEI